MPTTLTSKEIDEKRANNLCYWCDEKYSSTHKCQKKRLYVLQIKEVIDEEELETMVKEEVDCKILVRKLSMKYECYVG